MNERMVALHNRLLAMPSPDNAERLKVVSAALSWSATPYHHAARVKHHGCDCITFLAGVFEEAGLVPHIDIEPYPIDWHLHRDAERYLNGLMAYTKEISEGEQLPGDIVVWKIGRCFSHGAIIVDWPTIIHSKIRGNVTLDDAESVASLNIIGENTSDKGKRRQRRFFSYWRK